ncbi:MAG TPA: septal ring lytic transglycosylase RlpA family protein [Anaeromyxobacter sp.]
MKRAAAAALLTVLAACAHGPRREGIERGEPPVEERHAPRAHAEVGLASFYAEHFEGRRTASGTRYDPRALTCAHRSAPFGTRLRVTEMESGRSVVVTVNDRGPFARGRVVDLSLAAARALGMIERGLVRVRVERLAR